ncbi:MAG: helix-turn-helix domain-containing protein [Clostridiales bacterium]|nr:helix-turn-helix domain-containing protein [Clostridiales bacterium]
MSIGENIQRYRKKLHMSQKELAEELGYSTGTIQQYELDKREPNFTKICDIASVLKVKPYMLYDDLEIDETEERFIKACGWLEDAGFELSVPNEDDFFQKYSINEFEHGTVCKMDKVEIIDMVESCVEDANEIRDYAAIRYIRNAILKN